MDFTRENLGFIKNNYPEDYRRIVKKTGLKEEETAMWQEVASEMYLPYDEKSGVYLQQDAFLDKELIPVSELPVSERPINQKWSWDRILRSVYIKQADTLQGMYFFENHFDFHTIKKHFDFYEPFTVHESSLSPCVHAILAAKIDRMDKAYEMYLRTARLDLDDYNHEVHEGLHITSMAGTWLSIVQGFGGMRNFDNLLSFAPQIPKEWSSYSYKINYRVITLKIYKDQKGCTFTNESEKPAAIIVNGKNIKVPAKKSVQL
jgi:maltose phosphorylase